MGVLGDVIRFTQDTIKESLEECGFDGIKDELKDAVNAIKRK